jgi:hypothetical protein
LKNTVKKLQNNFYYFIAQINKLIKPQTENQRTSKEQDYCIIKEPDKTVIVGVRAFLTYGHAGQLSGAI